MPDKQKIPTDIMLLDVAPPVVGLGPEDGFPAEGFDQVGTLVALDTGDVLGIYTTSMTPTLIFLHGNGMVAAIRLDGVFRDVAEHMKKGTVQ